MFISFLPHVSLCHTPSSGRATRISGQTHQNMLEECGKYIDIFVHVVGIFEEVSARMQGKGNLKRILKCGLGVHKFSTNLGVTSNF